jgi:transposase
MTSLQANERRAETKPARPGQVAKIECQYTRHGTVCLTGNWDVVEGQMIATTIDETRNNRDFANHIKRTIQTNHQAGWVFVVDNLNTHCGEELVRMVANELGIDEQTLGQARKHGILKTMKTRREFLSDPTHRIRFVYIPKHSSWLNQVEVIFGVISRRVMRGGSFTSQADLKAQLNAFIEYFNRTYAKPMNWTYNGRPTKTKSDSRPRTWRENRLFASLTQKLALVTG